METTRGLQRLSTQSSATALDDTASLKRSGALMQIIARHLTTLLGAPSVLAMLPRVLLDIGAVVCIDRMLVLTGARPSRSSHDFDAVFVWDAPHLRPAPEFTECARKWARQLAQELPGSAASSAFMPALLEHVAFGSTLLVPISAEQDCWGAIAFADCGGGQAWGSAELQLLRVLGEAVGAAITRERCLQELRHADAFIAHSATIMYRVRAEPTFPLIYISENLSHLGHVPAQLLGRPLLSPALVHEDDRPLVSAVLSAALDSNAPPSTIECRLLTAAGASRWVEGRCTALRAPDGRVLEIEGLWLDISERKATEQHIAQLVRTDVLTGLANRASFADRLRQTFAAARRGAHAFAVLYLDLDRFKEVNDTLGHAAGDKLLQQVAARLRSCTREIDAIARIGGDEFAILQHEVNDYPVAGRLAEKLIEAVSAPYRIDGNDVRIGASVGISLYDGQTPDCETLLVQADQALYRSKESGRGQYRFFSDALDQDAHAQLTLAEELRRALVQQQLELRYQPQVELVSGRIVGMEASLRWNHPVRGPLLPEDILPVAEKFGVMQPLGRWMLDDACRQGALWRKEGMQAPVIALSITLAQIKMGAEFLRDVAGSLERWNLAPGDLEFAVTEQVLALATRSKSNVLDALRRLGIGIAIVDFGAQYSSLDYLRHYGVKRLRIARGMVAAATAEPGGSAMIRAIQGLAGALGVAVVAEGVETEEQRELLAHASAGAQGQGFYFSGAVAAEDTVRLLRAGIVPPENAAQIADDP